MVSIWLLIWITALLFVGCVVRVGYLERGLLSSAEFVHHQLKIDTSIRQDDTLVDTKNQSLNLDHQKLTSKKQARLRKSTHAHI